MAIGVRSRNGCKGIQAMTYYQRLKLQCWNGINGNVEMGEREFDTEKQFADFVTDIGIIPFSETELGIF